MRLDGAPVFHVRISEYCSQNIGRITLDSCPGMELDSGELTEEQISIDKELLKACEELNLTTLRLLESKNPDYWYQEPETGKGPLHIAVEAAPAGDSQIALDVLSLLLGNGAIWHQLSKDGETPGCTARRLFGPDSAMYACLVSAGVRAELLLTALSKTTSIKDSSLSADAAAIQEQEDAEEEESEDDTRDRNESYLSGRVEYVAPTDTTQTLLDDAGNAIMMSWESTIMSKSAALVVPSPGTGSVLNIGFGLGIIDGAIQLRRPARHVIIEAHPDVLAEMRRTGWYDRPNVEILEGRWQDHVDALADRETFDGIYYDPFEYWDDMHAFFDAVVALLNPLGTFSFFHGLGADTQTVYDVYTQILEIELAEFGMTVAFEDVLVSTRDEEWKGAKRRYWKLPVYRLPLCQFQQ